MALFSKLSNIYLDLRSPTGGGGADPGPQRQQKCANPRGSSRGMVRLGTDSDAVSTVAKYDRFGFYRILLNSFSLIHLHSGRILPLGIFVDLTFCCLSQHFN